MNEAQAQQTIFDIIKKPVVANPAESKREDKKKYVGPDSEVAV